MAFSNRSPESIAKQKQYAKDNLMQIKFACHKSTDADLIEWTRKKGAEAGSIAGYIKALIRADMEREQGK